MFSFLVCALVLSVGAQDVKEVVSGGASFPFEAYRLVFSNFMLLSENIEVSYEATSSGTGKTAMKEGTMDFAGADSLLKESDYEKYPGLQMVPAIAGAIAVVINIQAYRDEGFNLVLDAYLVSKIFRAEITRWEDEEIAIHNFAMCDSLVGDIEVQIRNGKSGTTTNFATWLDMADSAWHDEVGAVGDLDSDWADSMNHTSYSSSSAMFEGFQAIPNSIAFVPYSEVFGLNTGYTVAIINSAGEVVLPEFATVSQAISAAVWDERFNSIVLNDPAPNSWPISLYSYFIINMANCYSTHSALSVLNWYYTSDEAQNLIQLTSFAPVTTAAQEQILTTIRNLQCDGELILETSVSNEREEAKAIQTFAVILFVMSALITILGYGQFIIQFTIHASDEMRIAHLASLVHGLVCVFMFNAGIIPWFYSPSVEICQFRLLIFISWATILFFFNERAAALQDDLTKVVNDSGLDTKISVVLWIAQVGYTFIWIYVWDTRMEESIWDPVYYQAREFCSSDSYSTAIIIQMCLVAIMMIKLLIAMYQVLSNSNVNRRLSRKLLLATANVVSAFLIAIAYGIGQTELHDIDYFVIIALVNFVGFAPLFISLIEFDPKKIKASASGSTSSRSKGSSHVGQSIAPVSH